MLRSAVVLCAMGLFATGCSGEADHEEEDESDAALEADDREYSFRHEFPANELFAQPLTKTFPLSIERRGVRLDMTVTPTAKIAVSSPVVEGKATVGRRRLASALLGRPVPKILDAEIRATSSYSADLTVDLDVRWSTTERKDVLREIAGEIESKLNGGKALELAARVGETNVPLVDDRGEARKDLPLKTHYDVVATCSFEEIDGDLQGVYRAGARGTVVARAVYNSEGVEKRRFRRDPKKKFELDTSDVTVDPAPSFRFTGVRQHVKGSCSIQPVVVVSFDNGVGVRLRVDARSSFETELAARRGEGASWQLRATPALALWGETDIVLPIIHRTLDLETKLFERTFSEVVVDVGR